MADFEDQNFLTFYAAVVECANWADCSPDSEIHGASWSVELHDRLKADCFSFWCRMHYYIDNEKGNKTPDQAGHDFWLTRQGHGAGFWDGGWQNYGELLTSLSKAYGALELYEGEDGLIHAL